MAIFIATEIQQAGVKRLINVIDADIVDAHVDRIEKALKADKLLTAAQASATKIVVIE